MRKEHIFITCTHSHLVRWFAGIRQPCAMKPLRMQSGCSAAIFHEYIGV